MNKLRCLSLIAGFLFFSSVWAFESFVIKDIKIIGLKRIPDGTVLNQLPVSIGQRFDASISIASVRSLYATGFFDDVLFEEEDDVLFITLVERPEIHEITFEGNSDIQTEDLLEALKDVGLSVGNIYNRTILQNVKRELENQYYAQGKYGVKISSKVTDLEKNRIDINVVIAEGAESRIKEINVVGNDYYTDEKLLGSFKLDPLSIFSDNDKYSRQRLSGDLESLRSLYLDNGFINFNILSTLVAISPRDKFFYVTVNIDEGDQYKVSNVKVAGELIVPVDELTELLLIKPGMVFSRSLVTKSVAALSERLGKEGFAFSNVNPVPEINKENKEVSLTYFIDPGQRVYVRRVNVSGNLKTKDEVIRRELRQMEGGWISTKKVNRSRVRLQRLGFFEDVSVETPVVAEVNDQVDVNFSVSERPSGTVMAGLGFNENDGVLLNASISQNNFLGTGKKISATVKNSSVNQVYNFSYTNPYFTLDGMSRGFSVFNRETDAGEANISDYSTNNYGAKVFYNIPLTEFNSSQVTFAYEKTKLLTSSSSPVSINDFVSEHGKRYDVVTTVLGWTHDTRNRAILPDKGVKTSVSAEIAVPGSKLEYYLMNVRSLRYFPFSPSFIGLLRGNIGYAESYGDSSSVPFFKHFFAGGNQSVRGFRGNSLGPRELEINGDAGDPIGGAFKVIGNAEIIFPIPFVDESKSLRLSSFIDIGNVFKDVESFKKDELRSSFGLSLVWFSPLAPFTFNYSFPLNSEKEDKTERFQFTLGSFRF